MSGLTDKPLLVLDRDRQGPRGAAALGPDVAVGARLRRRRAAGGAAAPPRPLADEGARPRGERSARHRRGQPAGGDAPVARAGRAPGAGHRPRRPAPDPEPGADPWRAKHRQPAGDRERPLPRQRRDADGARRGRRAEPDRARRCPHHRRQAEAGGAGDRRRHLLGGTRHGAGFAPRRRPAAPAPGVPGWASAPMATISSPASRKCRCCRDSWPCCWRSPPSSPPGGGKGGRPGA